MRRRDMRLSRPGEANKHQRHLRPQKRTCTYRTPFVINLTGYYGSEALIGRSFASIVSIGTKRRSPTFLVQGKLGGGQGYGHIEGELPC
jgi:hypothetical protein